MGKGVALCFDDFCVVSESSCCIEINAETSDGGVIIDLMDNVEVWAIAASHDEW